MTVIPKHLVYVPNLGFIPKYKAIILSSLMTFAILFNGVILIESDKLEASTLAYKRPPLPIQQDKIVNYIKQIRPDIDNNIAIMLANAIVKNSHTYKIPVEVQLAIAKNESHFEQYALGSAGEIGFFQIMVSVHSKRVFYMLKSNEISNKNIYDPYTNATLGANILSSCLSKKKQNMGNALICYNGSSKAEEYSVRVLQSAKQIQAVI